MPAPHSRPRRRGLASALVALTLLIFGGSAAAAQAATINVNPLITGAGSITSTNVGSCVNSNQNETVTANCGLRSVSLGGFLPILFVDLIPAPRPTPAGHWSFQSWVGCPGIVQPGNICRIFAVGSQVVNVTPRVVFNDSVGPTVTAVTPVFSSVTDRGVLFSLDANEPLSIGFCSVDGGAGEPCHVVRQFAEGTHTVRVQGRDLSNNTGSLSGTLATFRVVDTKLLSGPANFSSVKRPTFRYSTLAGLDFECRLDAAAAFTNCNPGAGVKNETFRPPTELADGVHTLRIRAIDGPEFDRVPIVRTWTVDTVRPETTLDPLLGPGQDSIVTALTARFGFSSNEPGTIQCRLDDAPFAACTSPKSFADLPFGDRKFEARAVDRAGNVDATPASRSWNVQARDNDGDGFNQRTDCDDANPGVNPGRPEVLENGIDENCDGADGVNLDRDGDGVQRPADCNDGNAGIRPGANDVPNNDIDEDCQGGDLKQDEQVERIVVTLSHTFSAFKNFTTLGVMQVKAVPFGSKVTATCKVGKKKCPGKARKKFTKKNAFGTISLKKYTKRRLKVGTTITVTVTKPNAIGAVKIFKVRRGKKPKVTDRCLPPGARKSVAC
jgi:hypothetical protein